jgi:hypothetical protein
MGNGRAMASAGLHAGFARDSHEDGNARAADGHSWLHMTSLSLKPGSGAAASRCPELNHWTMLDSPAVAALVLTGQPWGTLPLRPVPLRVLCHLRVPRWMLSWRGANQFAGSHTKSAFCNPLICPGP